MSASLGKSRFSKELANYLNNFRYAVRLNKPRLTLRIIRDYLQLLFLRKVPLRYVDIALDYACNLRCVHCSAARLKRPHKTKRLEQADYEELARQCHDLGVITVGFTGGEPLVFPQLEQVIKAFKPGRTMISIKTNGTLLDERWLDRLKSWQVDSISIGLGPIPQEISDYDDIRGLPNSYAKSIEAAKKALEYGFRLIVGAVVSHENIRSRNLVKIIEITKDMGVILIFGLAVPAGNWNAQKQILLTEDDRSYLQELLQKYPHTRTDFESNFMTRGCGAVNEKLYITPYGDVIPCPFVQISFGNVLCEPLKVIRERAMDYAILKGYPDRCLAADHYGFIDDCLSHTFNAESLPVDHATIPTIRNYDEFGHKIN